MTLENQIRGLVVVFGVRLPRALAAAFIKQALKASEGVARDAGVDCGANRVATDWLSKFRSANQRIGFLRLAACTNSRGV